MMESSIFFDSIQKELHRLHLPPGCLQAIDQSSPIRSYEDCSLIGLLKNQFLVFNVGLGFNINHTTRIKLLGCDLPDPSRFLSTSPSGMAEAHRAARVNRFIISQLYLEAGVTRRGLTVQTFVPVEDVGWWYGVVHLNSDEGATTLNYLVNQFMTNEDCTPVCCGPAPDDTPLQGTLDVPS